MRWPPWRRAENRADRAAGSGGYTDQLVSAILATATGQAVDPSGLAALEVAAGLWSRAFAVAEVSPDSVAARAVTPEVLAAIGRQLVRRGEALFEIALEGRALALVPVGPWEVRGGPDPSTWFYVVTAAGPSTGAGVRRVLPAAGVVHLKYATDPARPWAGIGPLAFAASSSGLVATLEQRLREEIAGPVGSLIPVPSEVAAGADDDPLLALRADLNKLRGALAIAETTAAGWGEGRAVAPTTDWRPIRIGGAPPDSLAQLRDDSAQLVLAACGIPPALALGREGGTSQRESYRRFAASTIAPALRLVEAELREKLEPQLALGSDRLNAADLTGRARALGQMVTAGVALEDARRLAGLA